MRDVALGELSRELQVPARVMEDWPRLGAETSQSIDVKLRIALIGVFPFSMAGGGPTARLRNIALALKLAGLEPVLLQTAPVAREFSWRDITVREYSAAGASPGNTDSRYQPSSPLGNANARFSRINRGAMRAIAADLKAWAHTGDVDGVVFYNQDLSYALKLSFLCRSMRIPFVQQYAEIHQSVDYANRWRNRYWLRERSHLHVIPRYSDGSIVISRRLDDWVRRRAAHVPLLIPTIAEVPAVSQRAIRPEPQMLCISNGARRDSLPLLIQAMRVLKERGSRERLQIIGLGANASAALAVLREALQLEDRVQLTGFVEEDAFKQIVAEADVNILLRTDDVSSQASFPSRLYELFSTGAPVVLSAVGDLPHYFKDGIDCLFVPPGNAEALTDRLYWLEHNLTRAATIGFHGNATARRVFAPLPHGKSLTAYLTRLAVERGQPRRDESSLEVPPENWAG